MTAISPRPLAFIIVLLVAVVAAINVLMIPVTHLTII